VVSRVKIARSAAESYVYVLSMLFVACGRVGVEQLDEPYESGLGTGADSGQVGELCPTACENPHGTADCSAGVCLATCAIGYADCDGTPTNGCETSAASDGLSCGGCQSACSNAHGETSCSEGLCVPVCAPGFADCDGERPNGCETDLSTVTSCGTCEMTCSNAHGATSCTSGVCSPTCATGYADCDGDRSNGCEVSVTSDPTHCGACSSVCSRDTQICVAGQCQLSPCAAGRAECDGDLALACETDVTSSVANCGFCDNMCSAANGSAACVGSACVVAGCRASYDDCDGAASNGCEAALATSTQHCGSCATACTNPHGGVSCVASACSPSCTSGWGDCDTSRPNGCETSLDTVSNCGTCGRVCPANGGTPGCSAGICTTTCDLTGTFALKLTIPTTWPGTTVLASGGGNFMWWAKLQLAQSGVGLTGTVIPCGETVPDMASAPFIGENYGVTLPNSIYDGTPLPSTPTSGTLSTGSPGASFSLQRSALLVGATMADPVNGAWPSRTAIVQHDSDSNGKPAVTSPYKTGGSYDAAPTSSLGGARASASYMATRAVFSLNGTLNSCTQSTGSATVPDIDYHTIGCSLASGGDCSSAQASYLDSNGPNYQPGASTYTLVRLSGPTTCADVRAAVP